MAYIFCQKGLLLIDWDKLSTNPNPMMAILNCFLGHDLLVKVPILIGRLVMNYDCEIFEGA